jgi:hypothetical protein
MSNIDSVINMIKLNPDYEKNDMIEQIMVTLKVTRSNAQVYIYNAHRKMGTAPAKQPSKMAQAVVTAAMKTAKKDKYLPGQTSSEKRSKVKVNQEEVKAELERINADFDEFEKTHEKHPNGILWVKKKNLETMRAVSRRLKKEQDEVKERENELNDFVFGSSDKLSREDLRELGV